MIREARLSVDESGKLASALRTVPLCDADRIALLSCMAEPVDARHKLQHFEHFTNYVPQALWEAM
eukprot:1185231-Lingulodinium_polyedra.AAC.1